MQTDDRYTDAWGRVVSKAYFAFDALYHGQSDFGDFLFEDVPEIQQYNENCKVFDHPDYAVPVAQPLDITPEEFHRQNRADWLIPDDYAAIDIAQLVRNRCTTDIERARVETELALFSERELLPVLNYMHFMVETLRANGVWWGVGRGSSVASYVLYLLGVHKIDSLQHDLDIHEFLK